MKHIFAIIIIAAAAAFALSACKKVGSATPMAETVLVADSASAPESDISKPADEPLPEGFPELADMYGSLFAEVVDLRLTLYHADGRAKSFMNSVFSNVDEIWSVHSIDGGVEVELYSGRKIRTTFDSSGSTIEEEGMVWKDHVYYTPDQIESLKTAIVELRDERDRSKQEIAKMTTECLSAADGALRFHLDGCSVESGEYDSTNGFSFVLDGNQVDVINDKFYLIGKSEIVPKTIMGDEDSSKRSYAIDGKMYVEDRETRNTIAS